MNRPPHEAARSPDLAPIAAILSVPRQTLNCSKRGSAPRALRMTNSCERCAIARATKLRIPTEARITATAPNVATKSAG